MIKKESTFMEDGPPCHTARHSRLDVLVQYGAHPYQHPVIVLCSRKVLPIFSSGKMIKKESISMEDGPPCHTATLKIGCFGPIWGSPIPASSDCFM